MPICCRRAGFIRRRRARPTFWAWKCRAPSRRWGTASPAGSIGDQVCALLPGGGYAEFALADAGCLLPVPQGVASGGRRRPARSRLHRLDQYRGYGAASARRDAVDPWRHLRHRQSGHPDVRRARAIAFSPPPAATRNAKPARLRRAAAPSITRSEDFVAVVKEETERQGRGRDPRHGRRLLYPAQHRGRRIWGRIVNIAYQDGARAEVNFAPVLIKRLTLAATTLRGRSADQKRAIRDALLREVWPLLGTRIRPVVERVFPLAEAQRAHELHGQKGPYRQNLAAVSSA